MRVLLIQPPLAQTDSASDLHALVDQDNTQISMGLYSLTALLLDHHYDVSLVNLTTTPWREALRRIQQYQPDLVGITSLSHDRHPVMALVDAIKGCLPDTKIILGGIHASQLFSLILRRHPSVDFVAIGEAETSFLELVQRLDAGESPTGIRGIVQRKPGVDYDNWRRPTSADAGCCHPFADFDWAGYAETITDLGTLPIAAKYFKYKILATARGCPFRCTFCNSPQVWGQKVRNRPVAHVMEELKLLREKHGVEVVNFKDETFTLNRKRVIEMCQAMIDADLQMTWTCDTRVDCLDEEKLYWLRKAGCGYLSVGVESGSEEMLLEIDKKTSIKRVRECTALARKFGMMVRFYMIANMPGETDVHRQASIDVIEQCRPHFVATSLLQLAPGTALYRRYLRENGKDDSIWFEDPRRFIPYSDEGVWKRSAVGRKLLSFNQPARPLFPYTEQELRDCQAQHSNFFLPNVELAGHLARAGKFAEAASFYEQALEIWPNYMEARLHYCSCLVDAGRGPEAVEQLTRLTESHGEKPVVWLRLGLVHRKLGKADQAERCFRKVLASQPNHIEALNQLAHSLEDQSRYTEAHGMFHSLLFLAPNYVPATRGLARVAKAIEAGSPG